ncbi:MAG: oxidoreductase [Anaerolineales bacterium]|nr:MAG: oxidoreductase [Anaerolineales bacterium]
MAAHSRLHWGLLGTGRINRAVIPPIRSSNRSALLAVASRTQERAAAYASEWGIPRYHASYEALLQDHEIDVVYISLPNSLHAEWSIRAMQSGKHVLCEKPLTTSTIDMDKVIKTAQLTGMVIAEAYMYRHHPQTLLVKMMLDQGDIGSVQLIRGSFSYTNTRPSDPRFSLNLGGGCLWDVGCYPIGYASFLTGKHPEEVYGQQITGPTGVDLFFAGQLIYPDQITCQFDCSFISEYKAEIEITGTKGRITVPEPYKPGTKTRIIQKLSGQEKIFKVKGQELYQGEIIDIEDAVLLGELPRVSLQESRGIIKTTEALYQSARLSTYVSIQELTNQEKF